MISIIVSSYNEAFFKNFSKSVEETIGVPYEIIKMHNPGLMGICETYNRGVEKAIYPYICFSHEDITFNTQNWGKILITDFDSDARIGLIGIAGSAYKPWMLSGWHSSQQVLNRFQAEHFIHVSEGKATEYKRKSIETNLATVSSIDGCFMFSTRTVLDLYKFDDKLFKDFHCYDIDFSLQVNQKFKVVVDFNILISHYSGGSYDDKWFQETLKLHRKWKFPYTIGNVTKKEVASEEEAAFYGLVHAVCRMNSHYFDILKLYLSPKYISMVGLKAWLRSAYKSRKIYRMYVR